MLGFGQCTLLLYDDEREAFYQIIKNNQNQSLENHFVVNPSQIVKYSSTIGITGLCFNHDATCYMTSPDDSPVCFSIRRKLGLNRRLEKSCFDNKIDNNIGAVPFHDAAYLPMLGGEPQEVPSGVI